MGKYQSIQKPAIQRVYTTLLAIITWTAILLQLYLMTGPIINFFSYFTIISNLLVAMELTLLLVFRSLKAGKFFATLSVQTAIALYIFIVALVYNTVLRGLVPLTGWNLVADTLLHVVVPLLYVVYWLLFRVKGTLQWIDGFYWAIFPFAYMIYSLIRGSIVQWYPYPFLNADKFGYAKVFINVAIMIAVFFLVGILLILVTRSVQRRHRA